ncbi:MAG: hypothetical protein IKE45_01875 [Halomonas sp.]|nr:hypothetical protein [Halomonas sp.]MBR2512766.1 hypothetical protein [Halomonas sp.]
MGKARILEAHGDGRYTIEIIEARERAESAKQQAETRIQTLTAEVNQLDAKIQAAQQAVDQAAIEQNAAIEQWQQEVAEQGGSSVELDAFARKLLEAAGKRDALRSEKRSKELRIAADQALVARINALPPLRQIQAWCADYTDDLTGEVATAEVPGEIGGVIIKPGFEGTNQWSASSDGAMQPALAGTPASVFYNLAMKPGWQKWRPTYRTATITSIDGDTCSIALDAASSSQQGLNVNAQSSYSGVPILYMDCDGNAFEEGDRVLVAFAGNVERPTVVGFESGPRMCNSDGFYSLFSGLQDGVIPTDIHAPYTTNTENLVFRATGQTCVIGGWLVEQRNAQVISKTFTGSTNFFNENISMLHVVPGDDHEWQSHNAIPGAHSTADMKLSYGKNFSGHLSLSASGARGCNPSPLVLSLSHAVASAHEILFQIDLPKEGAVRRTVKGTYSGEGQDPYSSGVESDYYWSLNVALDPVEQDASDVLDFCGLQINMTEVLQYNNPSTAYTRAAEVGPLLHGFFEVLIKYNAEDDGYTADAVMLAAQPLFASSLVRINAIGVKKTLEGVWVRSSVSTSLLSEAERRSLFGQYLTISLTTTTTIIPVEIG